MAPLLENTSPTAEMCKFFSDHCSLHPRSPVVTSVFTPIVHRILKRNVVSKKICWTISPYQSRLSFMRIIGLESVSTETHHTDKIRLLLFLFRFYQLCFSCTQDFGKSPYMRRFVADFIQAIYSQNNGDEAITSFVMG